MFFTFGYLKQNTLSVFWFALSREIFGNHGTTHWNGQQLRTSPSLLHQYHLLSLELSFRRLKCIAVGMSLTININFGNNQPVCTRKHFVWKYELIVEFSSMIQSLRKLASCRKTEYSSWTCQIATHLWTLIHLLDWYTDNSNHYKLIK